MGRDPEMKTSSYEGQEYVESGEVRRPRRGDLYVEHLGHANQATFDFAVAACKILIPKEQKVSEVQDEYQIPVLVKADADGGMWSKSMNHFRGRVIMCALYDGGFTGPKWGTPDFPPAPEYQKDGWHFSTDHAIAYPTPAQVEAERAKLAHKPDVLPSPVRAALDAADLGCRKEGIEKLVEAIYTHPPKVSP
jgi:hypothetical protein